MNHQFYKECLKNGIDVNPAAIVLRDEWRKTPELAVDALEEARIAMDAQSPLTFGAGAGVPAWFTNIIDPKAIEALFVPIQAEKVYGVEEMGDFTTSYRTFPVIEYTGEVSSYGDFNDNGNAGFGLNYINRQPYVFQIMEEYGDRKIEQFSAANINYVETIQRGANFTLEKARNKIILYGVNNLRCYGVFNDPSLPAPVTPLPKAAGPIAWDSASVAEIIKDVNYLFNTLLVQSGYNINNQTKMTLVVSPTVIVWLNKPNDFGVLSAYESITKNFPNLRIETVAEFANTPSGNWAQLFVDEHNGTRTVTTWTAFKRREFPMVRSNSGQSRKVACGSGGTIWKYPALVVQMVGM